MVNKIQVWLWVVPILLFVTLVASRSLDADPIYNDEYHSLRHTGLFQESYTFADSWNSVAETSPEHAPFYFLMLNGWVLTVGNHPITARALSILVMVLAVSAVYRFGVRLMNRRVGLYAAFFVGTSALGIYYAHEVRMYVFLLFLVSGLLYFYWTIITSRKPIRGYEWLSLFLFSTILIYTHYFAITILAGVGIFHVLFVPKTRRWWMVAGVEVLAGIAFLPWLQVVIAGFAEAQTENIASAITQTLPELFYNIVFSHSHGYIVVIVILMLLSLRLIASYKQPLRFIWLVLIVSICLMFLISQFLPVLPVRRIRYTLLVFPMLTIIWAIGLTVLSKRIWLVSLILAGWLVMFVVFNQSDYLALYNNHAHFRFDDYPQYQRIQPILAAYPDQHAPVMTVHPSVPVFLIDDAYERWLDRRFFHLRDKDQTESEATIARILNDSNAVWVTYDPSVQDITDYDFAPFLMEQARPCLTLVNESDLRIDQFMKNEIPCELVATDTLSSVEFENGMQLRNSLLHETDDENYALDVWWVQNGVADESVGFSLQIFDDESNKVYQADHIVQRESIASYNIVLDDLADGDYGVFIILYTADTYDSIAGQINAHDFSRMNQIAIVTIAHGG